MLLGRFSATRVSSHAYVNPLVALALGYFVAGEIVTLRSLVACLVIVLSVVLIVFPSTYGMAWREYVCLWLERWHLRRQGRLCQRRLLPYHRIARGRRVRPCEH